MGGVRRIGYGLVVAVMLLLGANAPGASAYSITGGSYTGTATSDPTFTVADAYTITCPAALSTFGGTATGWSVTYFRPSFGGVDDCEFFGFPAEVQQDGSWGLTVTNGPSANGFYTGDLHIPVSTTTTIEVPTVGCTVTITGTQNFGHGIGWNVVRAFNLMGGIGVALDVVGAAYKATSCPFSSGTDGEFTATFVASGPVIS